ncbi:unnamed protein product [Sphagnum balticum]
MATWIDVEEYQLARPDVLAQVCKHFLGLSEADVVRVQAIDRLGVDLRVKSGDFTDEFRVGFRNTGVWEFVHFAVYVA